MVKEKNIIKIKMVKVKKKVKSKKRRKKNSGLDYTKANTP